MLRLHRLLLVWGLVLPLPAAWGDAPPPASARPQRTDLHGDSLPDDALARLGTLRLRHAGRVWCAAFSPDSRFLASVGADQKVRLWDPITGREIWRGDVRGPVLSLSFSPDGKLLALATEAGIDLRDPATGVTVRLLARERRQETQYVIFSPDGTTLATWDTGKTRPRAAQVVRLWDVATGKEVRQFGGEQGELFCVAFSPDGKLLATGARYSLVRVWDAATGKEIHKLAAQDVQSVAFSPDSKTLASTCIDKTIRFWDVASGKEVRRFNVKLGDVWGLSFLVNGKTLAGISADGPFFLDVTTGAKVRAFAGEGGATALALGPDGKLLASIHGDNAIRLWDVASGKLLHNAEGHRCGVLIATLSPDGKTLVSVGHGEDVRRWDLGTGGRAVSRVETPLSWGDGVVPSSDGKLIASPLPVTVITLYDTATGKEVRQLKGHTALVIYLAFSANGKVLASAGEDLTIRLWDLAAGKEIRQFRTGRADREFWLALSPDGKILALAQRGAQHALILYDTATGEELRQLLHEPDEGIIAIVFSPDGTAVATGSEDGSLHLWEVATGKQLLELPQQADLIGSLDFSTDGRTLLVGRSDGTVRLLERATGKERCRFTGHRGAVTCLVVAPDGRRLISGSEDTTLLVRDLTGRVGGDAPPEQGLEGLWADLAGDDAGTAYRSVWALARTPGKAVPFLQEHLQPAAPPDASRVARLIADLDSNRFTVREKAAEELAKLGEAAGPALRQALAGQPSAEVRRRVQQILDSLEKPLLEGEPLRAVRAVEALEHMDTPAARALLEKLSRGAAGARLTREAQAALGRQRR